MSECWDRVEGERMARGLLLTLNALLSRAGHEQNRVAPAAFHGVGSS